METKTCSEEEGCNVLKEREERFWLCTFGEQYCTLMVNSKRWNRKTTGASTRLGGKNG